MDCKCTFPKIAKHKMIWITTLLSLYCVCPKAVGLSSARPCVDVSGQTDGGAFISDGTLCYEFVPTKELWSVARDRCWKHGGRLVQVGQQDVKDKLVSQLRNLGWEGEGIWMGLNDRTEEGSWEWVTEQGEPPIPLGWSNWASRPWFGLMTDCAYMDPRHDWKWKEVVCSLKLNKYICQYHVEAITPIAIQTTTEEQSNGKLKYKFTAAPTQTKEEVTPVPLLKAGRLKAEKQTKIINGTRDLKVVTQSEHEASFDVGRQDSVNDEIDLWLVALLVGVGVGSLVSLFFILGCVLKKRSRKQNQNGYKSQPPKDAWISNHNARRYIKGDHDPKVLNNDVSSKLKTNTYIWKQQRSVVTDLSNGDDMYLHMGGKSDSGMGGRDPGPHIPAYPVDVNYDIPVPSGKYSEIKDPRKENLYESIDEIRRQLQQLENNQ